MSRAAALPPFILPLDVRAVFLLFGHPVGEENRQLSIDPAPILPAACPLFRDIHHGQIQHLEQTVIRGKHGLGFGHLPQLTVESLDGVGGLDQPSELFRKLEICAQIGPVFPPGG